MDEIKIAERSCDTCIHESKDVMEYACVECKHNYGDVDHYSDGCGEYERWTDNEKVHPAHYNDSKISPFDVWDDWNLDPYCATAIKYIKRAGSKAGESAKDDLEKAIDYLKEKLKREESKSWR